MAFQTKCEHCGTEYKLADKYLRRVLECRKCRESFRAEELAEETPRKRRRSKSDDDDDDDRRPRKRRGKSTSPSNALLWSGIAGGGFLAVVAVVVLVWALASRRTQEPVAAGPNAPADPVIQQGNAPPPNQGEFAPVVQGDPVQPPAVKQPRIPAFAPIASASNEVRWTVTADPIAPSPALANFRSLNIDSDAWRTKDLRFSQSDRPGRLAVLRIKTDPTTLWVDHYDLEAGRKLGSIKLANDDRSFETGAIPIPFEASPAGNQPARFPTMTTAE